MSGFGAVVLAAGRSSRYRAAGGQAVTKLVDTVEGEALVARVVRAALGSSARPIVVVTGHASLEVTAAIAGAAVTLVHNPAYAEGLANSLRCGLAALPADAEGAVVLLGDMPLVTSAVIDVLIAAARADERAQAVVPVADGQPGNPVLLKRELFAAVATLAGDEGARRLFRDSFVRIREVPLDDRAVTLDIDVPADLERR